MNEIWGPARVQFGDWRGTAAMNESTGVESDEWVPSRDWVVVGLEFYGGTEGHLPGEQRPRLVSDDASREADTRLYALALRRPQWELLGRGERTSGQRVEVTRFLVHGVEALDVLRNMKRWSIHALRRGLDAELVIVDESDVGL